MSGETSKGKQNWFKRFIIFLLAVVVAISFALVIYYFSQDDETIGFNESSVMVNKNDKFTITIIHENSRKDTTYELKVENNGVLSEKQETATNVYEFTALSGGVCKISLITNNPKFQNMVCKVSVGDGTKSNPYYIKTPEDLASIGNTRSADDNYVQVNSIDLSSYNAGSWIPLCGTGFSGNYDGSGFVIYNMNIDSESGSNAGLFTKINPTGSVTRIIFSKPIIKGLAKNSGVVAGINQGLVSRIEVKEASINVTPNGSVYSSVGGIVGRMERNGTNTKLDRVSFYENSSITANASIENYVGGIVGANISGTIINSFCRGTITSNDNYSVCGGIEGRGETDTSLPFDNTLTTYKKANVINCYSTMQITSTKKAGVVGTNKNRSGSSEYTNSVGKKENRYVGVYYLYGEDRNTLWCGDLADADAVDSEGHKLVRGISYEEAKAEENYKTYYLASDGVKEKTWNFVDVWSIEEGVNDGLPTLRMVGAGVSDEIYDPQSTFDGFIRTQAELQSLADESALDGSYKIATDLEGDKLLITSAWTQVGTEEKPFNGTLDGNGVTIVVSDGIGFEGLFGHLGPNAQIVNLTIQVANMTVTNTTNIGIFAHYNEGLIENCRVIGAIYSSQNSDMNIGGFVGVNARTGQITKSYVGVDSAGASSVSIQPMLDSQTVNIGLFAGINEGLISNGVAYKSSNIKISEPKNAKAYVGGIVGQNKGNIYRMTSMANISLPTASENYIAGGIVGLNDITTSANSIELCIVSGTSSQTEISAYMVGGIVGENLSTRDGVDITSCQVESNVKLSGNKVGGLIGRMYRGRMENSATFALLSANTMAGFAVTVEGYTGSSGNGSYAVIDRCFSSITFDANAGRVYSETTSLVRATNNYLYCALRGEDTSNPNSYKIAGYINNSKYNKTNLDKTGQDEKSYRQYSSAYIGSWNFETPNDGATSDADCKKASTFRDWNSDIWKIVEGYYPTIKF